MVGEEPHTTEPSALEIIICAILAVLLAALAVFTLISEEMPADWLPTVTTEAH